MDLSSLNSGQRQAVLTTEGPLLIIAGPGSGKTHTLVERILYLISEKGVEPAQLLVSTFTEKAAAELVTRISNRLLEHKIPVNLSEMYVGTLHSICLRFLDSHREFTRLKRSYNVLDQFDQHYMLFQAISRYREIEGAELVIGSERSGRWYQAQSLAAWINKAAEELLDASVLIESVDETVSALGRLLQKYEAHLEAENAIDFSRIQVEAYHMLENHPEILEKLQQQIRYLMVDEYQDTNTVQEALILKLAGPDPNLCVVGDDDQGLYRFRGATIRNILEFPQHFPNGKEGASQCAQARLETNYRSHPSIISFFSEWMQEIPWAQNGVKFRFDKQIQPDSRPFPTGPAVFKVAGEKTNASWYKEVLACLQFLRIEGKLTDWNQVAFLFSSVRHQQATGLANYLEANGIPVFAPRSNLYFQRDEVKLALGALLYLFPQTPDVREEGWQSERKPEVWRYCDQCLEAFFMHHKDPAHRELFVWATREAKKHVDLQEPTDYAFSDLFYQLFRYPLFSGFLGDIALGDIQDSRPARNLAIMSRLLTKFEYYHRVDLLTPDRLNYLLRSFVNNYLRYIMDGGQNEFEDSGEYAPSGCVSFMTIHQAKGLEFPVVFVGSLYASPRKDHTALDETLQNQFYRKEPFEPLEHMKFYDFQRKYYTAFSRAQHLLFLTTPENLNGKGRKMPSKYFKNRYERLNSWRTHQSTIATRDLKPVKETDLKQQYSFTSHISLFENCARQYKFYRYLDFAPVRQSPMLFGTLVHQTIEDIHKAALRGEADIITPAQIDDWFERNYRHLTTAERQFLAPPARRKALEQVQRYAERNQDNWDRVCEAEVDVSLVKDKYILTGKIDLIRGENNTVEIIDFKTEKKPDLHTERDVIDRYRRQLEVYGHIVEQRFELDVSRLHLYYTQEENGNPYVSFEMDEASVQETVQSFDEVVDRIESKQFTINKRPLKLCENCDLRHYCDGCG